MILISLSFKGIQTNNFALMQMKHWVDKLVFGHIIFALKQIRSLYSFFMKTGVRTYNFCYNANEIQVQVYSVRTYNFCSNANQACSAGHLWTAARTYNFCSNANQNRRNMADDREVFGYITFALMQITIVGLINLFDVQMDI